MATMGTLSGLATIRKKLRSSMERARKTAPSAKATRATLGRQSPRVRRARKNSTEARVMNSHGVISRLTTSFTALTKGMAVSLSERARDAAVLAHPPEVNSHEEAGHQRYAHAVQHV